jgi:predicted nucleic-acid-binding protein
VRAHDVGLDSNVIVRYIMQDDPRQAALATSAIERLSADEPGHVAIVTVIELGWVLDSCYDLTRTQIGDAIEALLRCRELTVDRADSVSKALRRFRQDKADLADCLIAQIDADAGCTDTLTFDRDAGMRLIS